MRQLISKVYTVRYLYMSDGYVKTVSQPFKEIDANIEDTNYYAFSRSLLKLLDTNEVDALVTTVEKIDE